MNKINQSISQEVKIATVDALNLVFGLDSQIQDININVTNPEFEGNYTIVLFSFAKRLKKSPEIVGDTLGKILVSANPLLFSKYNVIKGFLNLVIQDRIYVDFLFKASAIDNFGYAPSNGKKAMVEYSSPNTNKPLHLGHLRNNFLGFSIASILEADGYNIIKTCVVNDRGIHICKSMVAWQLYANGETPESTAKKGDHFVGDYYVKFNDVYKKEVGELIKDGLKQEEAEKNAPIMKATQQMLVDWENGEPKTIELWKRMNEWVYAGFDETYKKIGSQFDKIYYESETYLLGKSIVKQGLSKGVFFQKDDTSVWIDLTSDGLDEKLVMRKDGTSVYITQDIGLAEQKQNEFGCDENIYVVGDEQNYHFKVLKLICQKLEMPQANNIKHLSYGMVELPTGKMKSREGTVVDADDIVEEMIKIAKQKTEELGKVESFSNESLNELYQLIGLGALKFFLLRVDPRKKIIFNPEESIDFHGFTGPFIQYTYARIQSVLKKVVVDKDIFNADMDLLPIEKSLAFELERFPSIIHESASLLEPSIIAIYLFNLARLFNTFYQTHSIANAESEWKKIIRMKIATITANVIKTGMGLLHIGVPEKM